MDKPLCLPLRDLLEIELIAHLLVATVCCADVATVWCADKKAEYPFARLQFLASVSGDLPPHIQDGESVSGDDEEYADMPDLVYATDEEEEDDDDNTIPQLIDIRAPPNLNELVEFIPCSMHIEAAA